MPPKEKTLPGPAETLSNQTEFDSVMERLRSLQGYLTNVLDSQADDDKRLDVLTHQMEVISKQLDHLDGMLHEVSQFVDEHRPALNKALALLDPGTSVRKYFKARKGVDPDGG
jgi:ABC-type transporter Mla subunit MlaD